MNLVIVVEYVSFLYMLQNASNHLFSRSYMELILEFFFYFRVVSPSHFFREINFTKFFLKMFSRKKPLLPKNPNAIPCMILAHSFPHARDRAIGLWSWAFSFVSYLISNEIIRLQKSKGIKYSSIAGLNFLYIIGNMYNK